MSGIYEAVAMYNKAALVPVQCVRSVLTAVYWVATAQCQIIRYQRVIPIRHYSVVIGK